MPLPPFPHPSQSQLTSPPPTHRVETSRSAGEGALTAPRDPRDRGTARNRATCPRAVTRDVSPGRFPPAATIPPLFFTSRRTHRVVRGEEGGIHPEQIHRGTRRISLARFFLSRTGKRAASTCSGSSLTPPPPSAPVPFPVPLVSFSFRDFFFPPCPLPCAAARAAAVEERALPATTICRVASRPRDLVYWEYGK